MTCSVPVSAEPLCFYRIAGELFGAPAGMVLIPVGSFEMGDTFSEGNPDELPIHTVYIDGFYMDQYEVTIELWDEVYGWAITNGYAFYETISARAPGHPALNMDWFDAITWCNARSEMEGRMPCYHTYGKVHRGGSAYAHMNFVCIWSANGYRLPTEAEWEKTARAELSGTRFPWGNTVSHNEGNYYGKSELYSYDLSSGHHALYDADRSPFTSPVGAFAPNGYGLYDMFGNVSEFCWDGYEEGYYTNSPTSNPRGPSSENRRTIRGGDCGSWGERGRVASRVLYPPSSGANSIGFRTVLSID